ncbi:MAG: nicotinate-nucleotide adenylyltransferase [Dehalococcoidia bacterium]
MRIGILGGTFDPVHIAHLVVAEEARIHFSLEEVVFIPAGEPWLKAEQPVSPAELRLQMVSLAVESNPFFRVSAMEIERPGTTYSVDTLEVLHKEIGPQAELYFILGMDALLDLPRWKEPGRFLEMCVPVAFARPEHSCEVLKELDKRVPGLKERVQLMDGPAIGISGTEVRRRVAQGISIRYLVPPKVEQFIAEHGLYRDAGSR